MSVIGDALKRAEELGSRGASPPRDYSEPAAPGIAHPEPWSISAPRTRELPFALAGVSLVIALTVAVGSTLVSSRTAHAPGLPSVPAVEDQPPAIVADVPAGPGAPRVRPNPPQPAQPAPHSAVRRGVSPELARRFRLEGVMLGGPEAFAVINGTIVEAGQRIGGAVVQSIDKRGVTLAVDGDEAWITLRAD